MILYREEDLKAAVRAAGQLRSMGVNVTLMPEQNIPDERYEQYCRTHQIGKLIRLDGEFMKEWEVQAWNI